MSSTTIQQLREIAESMGLKGSEIMNFVRGQQALEREDKEKEDERKAKERRQSEGR